MAITSDLLFLDRPTSIGASRERDAVARHEIYAALHECRWTHARIRTVKCHTERRTSEIATMRRQGEPIIFLRGQDVETVDIDPDESLRLSHSIISRTNNKIMFTVVMCTIMFV